MDPQPYTSSRQHLDDAFERVRLLLSRHIVRYWYRLTDRHGELKDSVVSMEEVRLTLQQERSAHPPHKRRELPEIDEIEATIEAQMRDMQARVDATVEVELPIERLRNLLDLSPLELDVVVLLTSLQSDVGLNRLASLAWADFMIKHPTAGFVAEVLASCREEQVEIAQLLMPGHKLSALRFIDALDPPPQMGNQPPGLYRRLCASNRLHAALIGTRAQLSRGFDELDRVCVVLDHPHTLSGLGQPEALADHLTAAASLAKDATRSRTPGFDWLSERVPLLVMTGVDDTDHAKIAHAALTGGGPVVTVTLWRVVEEMEGHPVPQIRVALEETLAAGLREALLLDGTALITLRGALSETRVVGPILDVMARLLPHSGRLSLLSLDKVIAPLRELLGPCAELPIQPPQPERRLGLWTHALHQLGLEPPPEISLRELSFRYTASASSITAATHRAAFDACLTDTLEGERIPLELLDLAVRQQMQNKLHLLATPFATSMTWDDMVLPDETRERLKDMVNYGQNKRKVHEQWGFARLNAYGNGLTALFSGPPGTGKTLSAAIIARELGSELFMIDLSKVVDKYIGETEKNLGRIFDEAERSNVVLLFDEADSLFGKRTSVKSANDRYANLEVNYLLQRMEHFPGTSILTTNLETEMDDALQRRIRFKLAFRMPDVDDRELLWQKLIPPQAPVTDDIDFEQLAIEFELAPAFIKNAIIRAAFHAAKNSIDIDYDVLYQAAVDEVRELGHLVHHY